MVSVPTGTDVHMMAPLDQRQTFAQAFVRALAAMPDVHKDKTAEIATKSGGTFRYAYADLASIIALVRPVLAEHGLAFAQAVDSLSDGTVSVTTRIYHSGGHMESFGTLTLSAGTDARQAGSAVTYARRYSLCAALGIAPDEDTDGAGVGASAAGAGGHVAPPASSAEGKRTTQQNKTFYALFTELDRDYPLPDRPWKDYAKEWISANFDKTSSTQLTEEEADELIAHLRDQKAPI